MIDSGNGNAAVAKKSRGGRWFMVLFGMPFAAVGIGVFGWLLLPALRDWYAMQAWEPVQAELLSAELVAHSSDGSTTYSVLARYRYEFAGSTWESQRVAISDGADNIGDFQQELGETLERAHANGEPITVYVNPACGADAIINRELRPGLFAMMSLFALLFGGVGLALIFFGLFAKNDDEAPVTGKESWQARPEWASAEIFSDTRSMARNTWLFALLWCAITAPAALAIPGELEKDNWPILFVLLFVIVGIGLLVAALRLSWSSWKFGRVAMLLDPHPGAIGGDVAGYIDVPVAYDAAQVFLVALTCQRTWVSGSGKNRSTRHEARWNDEKHLHAEPLDATHVRVWFSFSPPAGLPESEAPCDDYHNWHIVLSADLPGLDLSRRFDVPVFATGKRSARQITTRVLSTNAPDLAAIERLTNFRQVPGGASMNFRAGRHWLAALVAIFVFGAGFCGGAYALWQGDDSSALLVSIPLALIGVACVAAGLWMLGNRLYVEANDTGVLLRRWLFGMPVIRRSFIRDDIAGVGIQRGSTTTTATRTTVYYNLVLKTLDGKQHGIGDGFRGVTQARQAAESFALYARLAYLGELEAGADFAARKAAFLAQRKRD